MAADLLSATGSAKNLEPFPHPCIVANSTQRRLTRGFHPSRQKGGLLAVLSIKMDLIGVAGQ